MRVAVTVDDREPPELVAAFEAHPDVERVAVVRLDAGDVVADDVGFERKTLRDYVDSAVGRTGSDLHDQLARLAAAVEHPYLLLEADLSDVERLETGVSPASVRGSIASVVARHGVPVIPCSDRERLVDMAVRIARKHREAPSPRALPAGAVPSRREPVAKRMYGCVEGIGPTLAEALYEAYPTVESLLAATPEELMEVPGIGETRARAVHEALRSEE